MPLSKSGTLSRLAHICSFGCIAGIFSVSAPATTYAVDPVTFHGFDESSMSAEAKAGMDEIFSGRMFHNGMPLNAVEPMKKMRPQPKGDLGYDPTSPEGRYYSSDSIPAPEFRPSGTPLGLSVFERNGVALRNANCFHCHAGVVNGQVVSGLGNNRSIPPRPPTGMAKVMFTSMVSAALKTDSEKAEFRQFMKGVMAGSLRLPEVTNRGDHFGAFEVWSLGARLINPEKTGLLIGEERTDLVKLVESTKLPPINPMPWWLVKYKTRNYWYSDAGPFEATSFAVNFTVAHAEVNQNHAAHIESTVKALAFVRENQSPVFPESLDADLVSQGTDIFHGRKRPAISKGFIACKNCHGSYTRKDSNSDLSVPGSWNVSYSHSDKFRNVNTDSAYNDVLQRFRPVVAHLNKVNIYFESQGTPELAASASVPNRKGYVAPPLVGVWATAPYFHNGSVPTVTDVLNSKERPEIWTWNFSDPHAYDLKRVGLESQSLTHSEYEASAAEAARSHERSRAAIDHRARYDTRSYGRANTGHKFGDSLSNDERTAVIEFLKSLSGPDMDPLHHSLAQN